MGIMQINGLHRIPIKSDLLACFFFFFFFVCVCVCVCVLHLPVCVLERCHSDTTAAGDQAAYSSTRTNILETAS